VWGAALHVVYLAAVPEALRVTVAQRNAGVWKVRASEGQTGCRGARVSVVLTAGARPLLPALWLQRLSLAALLGVAVYEGVATSQLRAASNAAAAEGKRLRAALREL
jgi:hypothetical protein